MQRTIAPRKTVIQEPVEIDEHSGGVRAGHAMLTQGRLMLAGGRLKVRRITGGFFHPRFALDRITMTI
jgi:hypothetical protein